MGEQYIIATELREKASEQESAHGTSKCSARNIELLQK